MRLQAALWSALVGYYVVLAVIYALAGGEAVGVTLLVLAAGFGGLGAGWLWRATQRAEDLADRPDLDVVDGPVRIGSFPSASLRPLAIGVAMTGMVLGIAAGLWMTVVSAAILASQIALMTWDEDDG